MTSVLPQSIGSHPRNSSSVTVDEDRTFHYIHAFRKVNSLLQAASPHHITYQESATNHRPFSLETHVISSFFIPSPTECGGNKEKAKQMQSTKPSIEPATLQNEPNNTLWREALHTNQAGMRFQQENIVPCRHFCTHSAFGQKTNGPEESA